MAHLQKLGFPVEEILPHGGHSLKVPLELPTSSTNYSCANINCHVTHLSLQTHTQRKGERESSVLLEKSIVCCKGNKGELQLYLISILMKELRNLLFLSKQYEAADTSVGTDTHFQISSSQGLDKTRIRSSGVPSHR